MRTNLKTVRAYLVRKDFQQVWEYRSSVWAGKFLDQWRQRAMRSLATIIELGATARRLAPLVAHQ
ncbi:MAG: transposase [Planctomycetota bacterium]